MKAPKTNTDAAADPTESPRVWHRSRERGSLAAMKAAAWLYQRIGHRFAALLVHPTVLYFFLTDRAGRSASRRYLARLYATPEGRRALGRPPGTRDSLRHYLEFGHSVLDRVGIWLARGGDFDVETEGLEHLAHLIRGGRGGLILGAHIGSFDAMRLLAQQASPRTVKILMFSEHAARINELFRQLGRMSGNSSELGVISAKPGSFGHVLEVRESVSRGEVVAILADRLHPNERGGRVAVDLLGERAFVPESPIRLAAALRCPVVLMAGMRLGPRRYKIIVEPFAEKLELPRGDEDLLAAVCQRYADWLARMCAQAPYQWFNFYDFWADTESKRAAE